MQIIIHRGTHQIGGMATEIRTPRTRLLIDMGDELCAEGELSRPLSIPGITDKNGRCDGVLFTHNHGDHVGQLHRIRKEIPLYMGSFAKAIFLAMLGHENAELQSRAGEIRCFTPGKAFSIGDICITPFSVDHSACDSYMFLLEAEGRKLLYTGDFRMHGFRGKAIPKILAKLVGKTDVLIIEGTSLSRPDTPILSERELQQLAKTYMEQYKYVFVLCAATNLERICALCKAVPKEKAFVCDKTQEKLLKLTEKHWGRYSPLYRNFRYSTYKDELLESLRTQGFLMTVRDNHYFRRILPLFDREQSILLYSMWDGYRSCPGSTIPEFLELAGRWVPFHTSGHATPADIRFVINQTKPDCILPMHTQNPTGLQLLCPDKKIILPKDGEVIDI